MVRRGEALPPLRAQPLDSTCFCPIPREDMKTRSIVLVLLVMQTTAAVLLMRYSRTTVRSAGSGPPYLVRLGSGDSGKWRHTVVRVSGQ